MIKMLKPVFDGEKLEFLKAYSKNEELKSCSDFTHNFICRDCPLHIIGFGECHPTHKNRMERLKLAKQYFAGPKQLELFQ